MRITLPRLLSAAFLLLVPVSLFAAETQRYLVGTGRPPLRAHLREIVGPDLDARAVVAFEGFEGFAADLTDAEAQTLRTSGQVRWVEPVLERVAFAQPRHPQRQTIPLGLTRIFAREAQAGAPKATINVVVIDTGIDYRHPDLKAAFAGGINVQANSGDPLDDNGHGTHVAGTVAATDNDFGVVGIAPRVRLWGAKVLDSQGKGNTENVIKAIEWVSAQKKALGGHWIINLSLGSADESLGEREAFQKVADEGILIIAAAGNLSTATLPAPVAFPAAYPSVIAVAAVDFAGKHATFSCQGPELDFSAPGVDVLSTIPVGSNEVSYLSDGDETTFGSELLGSRRGVVSGEFVYCGAGKVGDFPAAVAGRIALIKRGEAVSFADKTRRAKEAGAIAVAIFDNVSPSTPGSWTLLGNDEDRLYDWPIAIRLSMLAGEALVARGTHGITVAYTYDDYLEFSGTSMSTPHVVGAAALLWALAPDASKEQIINALTVTSTDLGDPGSDALFGIGLINVREAAHRLAPEAFSTITTGRPLGFRGRK